MSRRVPARDVLAALYRFGPPRRVAMLAAALAAEARARRWAGYMADMAYNLVALLCRGDPGVPSYGELTRPADGRSEAEIAEEVLKGLEGDRTHEAI